MKHRLLKGLTWKQISCSLCLVPKKASNWFCFCGVPWHLCPQHRSTGFALPPKPGRPENKIKSVRRVRIPLGTKALKRREAAQPHGTESTKRLRVAPGGCESQGTTRPANYGDLHQRLCKRLRITPNLCHAPHLPGHHGTASLEIQEGPGPPSPPHPRPHPQAATAAADAALHQRPKAAGVKRTGKVGQTSNSVKRRRGTPAPPPSQRLLAYLDRGLIQGNVINAAKRNAENPPEDHSHCGSHKKVRPNGDNNPELDNIIRSLGENNLRHPAFIKSTLGNGIGASVSSRCPQGLGKRPP